MKQLTWVLLAGLIALGAACGVDGIDSDEAARRAYLGLDPSIEASLNLGFAGFNAATSANIPPQTTSGPATGTLTISGQVDQGASANKEMRLRVGMVDYSVGPFTVVVNPGTDDEEEVTVELTYATSEVETEQPYLQLSLRNIPTGTLTGTLTGTYQVRGDLEAAVTLDLTLSGALMDGGGGAVLRVDGTTTVTGTATSGDGVYTVNLTL